MFLYVALQNLLLKVWENGIRNRRQVKGHLRPILWSQNTGKSGVKIRVENGFCDNAIILVTITPPAPRNGNSNQPAKP